MTAPVKVKFNRGELSPQVIYRPDTDQHASGLKRCRNAFVSVEGGVIKQGGTEYVATCLNPALPSYLIPFIYATQASYMLEFSENRMRVLRDGKPLVYPESSPNAGIQVIYDTKFTQDDLPSMHYAQIAGLLTITTGTKQPQQLQIIDEYTWEFSEFKPTEAVYQEANVDETKVFGFSAADIVGNQAGDVITINNAQPIFEPYHAGQLLKIEEEPSQIWKIGPWEASKKIADEGQNPFGERIRSNGKVYICDLNQTMDTGQAYFDAITGVVQPRHEEGVQRDGNGNSIDEQAQVAGLPWRYEHSGYGVVRIDSVTSPTQAQATIISVLPSTFADDNTYKWAFQAWSNERGLPRTISYFGDRLYFGGTIAQPESSWGTEVGVYNSFKVSTPLKDTDSIEITLAGREVNNVQNILPMRDLIFMTSEAEWLAGGGQNNVITPETTNDIQVQGYNGSSSVQPLIIGSSAIYIQRAGSEVRSLGFSVNPDGTDGYGGDDLSLFSSHLFKHHNIVSWAFCRSPYSLIYAVRDDGVMLLFTYQPGQRVGGWTQCERDEAIIGVRSILEGSTSKAYMVVKHNNNYIIERQCDPDPASKDDYCFSNASVARKGWVESDIIVSGLGFTPDDTVTLTIPSANFIAGDVGSELHIRNASVSARCVINSVLNGDTVQVVPLSYFDESLQSKADEWGYATSSLNGLDHLEGREVVILADGDVQPSKTVVNGAIELDDPAVNIVAGLYYRASLQTLPVDSYSPRNPSTIRHQFKKIKEAHIGLINTRGIAAGQDASMLSEYVPDNAFDLLSPPEASGDVVSLSVQGVWDKDGSITIVQDYPLPMHVASIGIEVDVAP